MSYLDLIHFSFNNDDESYSKSSDTAGFFRYGNYVLERTDDTVKFGNTYGRSVNDLYGGDVDYFSLSHDQSYNIWAYANSVDLSLGGGGDSFIRLKNINAGGSIETGNGDDHIYIMTSRYDYNPAGDAVLDIAANEGNDIIVIDIEQIATTVGTVAHIDGGEGNDTINGDAGNDIIAGGGGNDTIDGGADNDTLYGGSGNDALYGSEGRDILYGQDGQDILRGGLGNDTLIGGNDSDTLYADEGLDVLWGQGGIDIFAFEGESAFSTRDMIGDFADGEKINIADVLSDNGYVEGQDILADWVQITSDAYHSYIAVDRDGSGTDYGMSQIAFTNNYNSLTLDDIETTPL